MFIRDNGLPPFSSANPIYASQLKKDLLMNVYQDGQWGSFRHLQLDTVSKQTVQVERAHVTTLVQGDLSSLKWITSSPTDDR